MTPYEQMLDAQGKLKPEYADDLLVEIVSGRFVFEVGGEIYASCLPGTQVIDQGRMIYVRMMHEATSKFGLMTRQQLRKHADEIGAFDPQEQEQKSGLEAIIMQLKSARENTANANQKKLFDVQIAEHQKVLMDIVSVEEAVFGNSAESRSEEARASYFVFECTRGGHFLNEPVWKSWEEYQTCNSLDLLREARRAHYRVFNGLPLIIIRALTRSLVWKQRWKAARESHSPVFGSDAAVGWDNNKIALVEFSQFFDTLLQHPDFPGEPLLDNEAELQNWINSKIEENKRTRQQQGKNRPSAGTFRGADGRALPSQSLGSHVTQVKQGYRIRPPGQRAAK